MIDLHFSASVDVERVARAVAELAGVRPTDVVVTNNIANADAHGALIVVEHVTHSGDFPMHISIYPQVGGEIASNLDAARALAKYFNMPCLHGDAGPNPYFWTLVEADGSSSQVAVDVEALARDELVLDRAYGK